MAGKARESSLAKNTFILSIGTFLPKLAAFVTLPILTEYLTKEEYGTYDLITVLVSLLLPAVTLQIQLAAFRFLLDHKHKPEELKRIITNIFAFIIPTSFISLIILFICLPIKESMVKLFICLYFFADIFVNAARQVCRGIGRAMDYSISALLSALGKIIFTIICIYILDLGLLGTVVSLFCASLFSFIYLLFKVKLYQYINIQYIDLKIIKELLLYSWPMVPNSMSSWVMRASDRLVVTAVMGISANAIYAVANKIPSLLNIAQNTFTLAWQENASMVAKDSDASEYYTSMFRTLFKFLVGTFCLLSAATPILFRILIRGDYGEAYRQMPILYSALFFLGLSTYLGGIFIAYKKTKSIGITTVAAAAINLLVDITTINTIGLYAASGSTLISYLFLFIFRAITVQKIVIVSFDKKILVVGFAVIIVFSIICYLNKPLLNIINLPLGLIVFVVFNKSLVHYGIKKIRKILDMKHLR